MQIILKNQNSTDEYLSRVERANAINKCIICNNFLSHWWKCSFKTLFFKSLQNKTFSRKEFLILWDKIHMLSRKGAAEGDYSRLCISSHWGICYDCWQEGKGVKILNKILPRKRGAK